MITRYLLSILLVLLAAGSIYANDGAFFARGNQLIPITETDISVKKEILQLKKVNNQYIEVSVYYEFYNPKEEKEITVGFEAYSPEGDVNGAPRNGRHPYMRDFTVSMNDHILPYAIAYVHDTLYNQHGSIKTIDLDTFTGNKSGNYVDFFYVYHFKARFKKGLNIIKHTYNYNLSGSISYLYDFEYVLTAANRWSNKQIDDFTLILDMGDFETFHISKTFFKKPDEWIINGIGKTKDIKGAENTEITTDALKFYMQKGNLVFSKKNFSPQGELFLYSFHYWLESIGRPEEKGPYLPFSHASITRYTGSLLDPKEITKQFSPKILKNLPFARRGYIFKDQDLQQFYQGMDWYMLNPGYEADMSILPAAEQQWIEQWK